VHSASFDGNGKIKIEIDITNEHKIENGNSFSFEFAVSPTVQSKVGLLYAKTEVSHNNVL